MTASYEKVKRVMVVICFAGSGLIMLIEIAQFMLYENNRQHMNDNQLSTCLPSKSSKRIQFVNQRRNKKPPEDRLL